MFTKFILRQEDDRLVDNLELGLRLANLPFAGVTFTHCPVKEPAQIEVMLLDGLFLHLGADAQVADKGVDAVIVEVVEGVAFRHGEKVLAEGCPAFHSAGGPLARNALLTAEVVEILDGRRALGSVIYWLAVDGTYVRALTGGEDGEWNYLFSKRDNASDLYKGAVSITIGENTASNCVVIAPDGYTGTIESSYDTAAWAEAEASGLVCLPAAGFSWLNGSNLEIRAAGSTGNYWSASPYSDVDTAWCLDFDDVISTGPFGDVYGPNINPTASSNRKYGNSIRLVFSVSK